MQERKQYNVKPFDIGCLHEQRNRETHFHKTDEGKPKLGIPTDPLTVGEVLFSGWYHFSANKELL